MRTTRRQLLALTSAFALMPALCGARAQSAGMQLILLSDLHSAYERMGQLLAAIEMHVAHSGLPVAVLINGDVFEKGNVVASRSGGEIDWAFLTALAQVAPTIVNIGNHESDFDADLRHFTARANEIGVTVISNIIDARDGSAYAPAAAVLDLGGMQVQIAGIATDAINTYPADTRPQITVPAPAAWAAENLPQVFTDGAAHVVLSHAGVVPDREILAALPDGALLVGGHDHLVLEHAAGATRYIHTGAWSALMTIATITATGTAPVIERIEIDRAAPLSAALADLIPAVLAAHLTPEETASVATLEAPMSLGETGRFAARAMAETVGADVGFIGHTSFGTGLPAGDVTVFDYNAGLRFDGKLMRAEVDAATLAAILAISNQDGDMPLESRTGDFLYADPTALADKQSYVIVTNDWGAMNAAAYFQRSDLTFTEVPDLRVKAIVAAALQR
ncbi:Ser/Thr protein phosphatase family protein [Ketogulonicigenium vulgare]|uniref:Ser/Thr protein phosphatase family protein n=3 Tax=Ketogulonicigenium vulgare TaxID=92945 RepID=F9Y7R5_KETVW|nr:Ser/Thr protein phosphatase family protein [Ketogulonicigenium vulgare WSH-001]ALJ80099.1 serine/threonine protein phosphatase [Ketogulonicigenium vulgare]AOZ53575.1 Ser/Thr protein phosphatase family protein [Ketogulonicigenium vulgare]